MNDRQRIEEKVFRFIEEHRMLSPGDKVIAGVSGGADSVCLLFMLLEWAQRSPLSLEVVHVNHKIRQEAGEDARYVETLCDRQGIPFILEEADVLARAGSEKISEEEAGRLVRYEAFHKAAVSFGADKIAVAHNANDRAETMLFHLFRGAGLSGLCSIRPVRDEIVRPILCLERSEVESYLEQRQIPYCTDRTNDGNDYTRNRIRHHILPCAEKEVVQGCVSHMAGTADMLTDTEDYLQQQTLAAMESCVVSGEKCFWINIPVFCGLHPVIRGRLLYTLFKSVSPNRKDISRIHVQEALGLFEREGNRMICLPHGIRCKRQYDQVILDGTLDWAGAVIKDNFPGMGNIGGEQQESLWKGETGAAVTVDTFRIPPQGLRVELKGLGEMEFTVFSHEKSKDIPENRYTKWFDYDKIKKSLIIRARRTGDYLTISRGESGQLSHKQLKDYMIGEKIPRQQRDLIPLLAQDSHILWVTGYRISEYYKISENTKRILQVQLRGSRESGGMEETNGGTNQGTVK